VTVTDQASHEELRGMLGVYALGVLDDDERATIELHLAGCLDCRRAAITQLESAALLVAEPLRLPPGLWDAIGRRIHVRRHS
jgi:hypothetical protein